MAYIDDDRPPEEEIPTRSAGSSPVLEGEEEDHLIRWMLSLTPTQRLEVAQGFVDSVAALRNGRRA